MIARAERLYEELLWARRDLQDALVRFRAILDGQDPLQIREHRSQFARMLEHIESQA